MLRLLQSTSSHISISISIFLLNIHPAFTSESPRSSVLSSWPHTSARFPPKPGHPSLRRLELPPPFQARGSFPSRRSQLRWRFVQRSAWDSFTAAPSRPVLGALPLQSLFTLSNCCLHYQLLWAFP